MTSIDEATIERVAQRFLQWKLPESFNPDGGISFQREFNTNTPWPMKHQPIGTNLFTLAEATEMVRFIFKGEIEPASPSPTTPAGVDAVAVKALEWREPNPTAAYPEWRARDLNNKFEAVIDTSRANCFGKFPLTINGVDAGEKFDTLVKAKARAQSVYEARIRSALTPAPTPVEEPNFCESCAMDLATCDCVNPRPVHIDYGTRPKDPAALVAECEPYLKPGETPRQRMDRDFADAQALTELLAKARANPTPVEAGGEVVAWRIVNLRTGAVTLAANPDYARLCNQDDRYQVEPLYALAKPAPAVEAIQLENDRLRALLATSNQPCVYCGLAADDWQKCPSGFPGCDRADDAALDPAAQAGEAVAQEGRDNG